MANWFLSAAKSKLDARIELIVLIKQSLDEPIIITHFLHC